MPPSWSHQRHHRCSKKIRDPKLKSETADFKATSLAGTAGLLANSGKAWLLRGRPIGFLASLVAPEAVGLGGAGFLSVLLKVRGPLRSLVLVLGFATIFATLGQSIDT